MSPAEYCREIEAYLCRKNDGHLIRIVGPVFGTVTGWAEQGIPLKIAFQGIDRYFERKDQQSRRPGQAVRPRRRPVPIQFCEADILDAFDEWRRALGLSATAARAFHIPEGEPAGGVEGGGVGSGGVASGGVAPGGVEGDGIERAGAEGGVEHGAGQARRKAGLQTHIDRVMARLTQRRVDAGTRSAFGGVIDSILGRLDVLRAEARGARGAVRERVAEALARLDRELLDAALGTDTAGMEAARAEARRELETYRARMAPEAFARAVEAATERLVRERMRLPIVRVDE